MINTLFTTRDAPNLPSSRGQQVADQGQGPFHCSCFSSCLEQSCPLEIEHDPRMWAMEEILNFVVAMLKKKKKKEIGN